MLNVADIARQVITVGALCFSSNDVIAKKNVFMPVFAYLQAKWKYDVQHDKRPANLTSIQTKKRAMSANKALKPQTMTHPTTCEKQNLLQTLCQAYSVLVRLMVDTSSRLENP